MMHAASGFERKNPLGLIAAFKLVFGHAHDVRLLLLISYSHHCSQGIEAINNQVETHDKIETKAFYANALGEEQQQIAERMWK